VIRFIDLPGVRDLENAAVLQNRIRGADHEYTAKVDAVLFALFGLRSDEVGPEEPLDDEDDNPEAWGRYDEAWKVFDQADLSGWDFTDDHGRELLIANQVRGVVQTAASGVRGRMPDVSAAKAQAWGDGLADQAERFRRERRKP